MMKTSQMIYLLEGDEPLDATQLYNLLYREPLIEMLTAEELERSGRAILIGEEIFKEVIFPALQYLRQRASHIPGDPRGPEITD